VRKTQRSRKLATFFFTDIVGSTEVAGKLDDRGWRELVGRHHDLIRRSLKAHNGHEVDTAGDGFFATFETGADALRCASESVRSVQELGIDVRVGLHTGEVERVGSAVRGIAVHIGARVMSAAGPAEILVTSTLRELTSGGGFAFEDAGEHALRGIEGSWHLFRLVRVDDEPVPTSLTRDAADEDFEPPVPHPRVAVDRCDSSDRWWSSASSRRP
jgi:class 3 adenylate cyclase